MMVAAISEHFILMIFFIKNGRITVFTYYCKAVSHRSILC